MSRSSYLGSSRTRNSIAEVHALESLVLVDYAFECAPLPLLSSPLPFLLPLFLASSPGFTLLQSSPIFICASPAQPPRSPFAQIRRGTPSVSEK